VGNTKKIQGNFMEAELERERYSRGQGNEFGYKILVKNFTRGQGRIRKREQ
jgi:hypothetical protein